MVKRRHRARAGERGMALFIVVLVVVLLSAIGVFAVRAASLVDIAAGFSRKSVQTFYVSEFAGRSVAAEIASRTDWLKSILEKPPPPPQLPERCRSTEAYRNSQFPVTPINTHIPCKQIELWQVHRWVQASPPGLISTEPDEYNFLGHLSRTDWHMTTDPLRTQGSFVVEVTDFGPAPTPEAGYDLGNKASFQYYQAAFTAIAQVRPPDTGNQCDTNVLQASGIQQSRGYVTFRARR